MVTISIDNVTDNNILDTFLSPNANYHKWLLLQNLVLQQSAQTTLVPTQKLENASLQMETDFFSFFSFLLLQASDVLA